MHSFRPDLPSNRRIPRSQARALKILHVIGGLSPRHGGTTQAILQLCEGLQQLGVTVEIATTNAGLDGRVAALPHDGATQMAGIRVWLFASPVASKYGLSPALRRWLRVRVPEYDVVHVHGVFAYSTWVAAAAAQRHDVPYIVRPSGELGPEPLRRNRALKRAALALCGHRLLRRAALVHFTTAEERTAATAALEHVPLASTCVVPTGVPVDAHAASAKGAFRRKYGVAESEPVVATLARLDPIKGLDVLIEASARVAAAGRQLVLVIAGSGHPPYEAELRRLAASAPHRTIFTGHLDALEKYELLRDADVFALPSRHENLGLAVLEAMGAGVPVVVSPQVAVHREIHEAEAGLVVPRAPGEFARALQILLDQPAERARRGVLGQSLVTAGFDPHRIAQRMLAEYHRIAAPQPRRHAPATVPLELSCGLHREK